MFYRATSGVVGTISLGATTIAAAAYDEWPPYVAGAALGTLAFLWSIKNAAEDRRYKALEKRLEESEKDIDAGRRDRQQMSEFYGARIQEIEAKNRARIEELEQAKLKIMLELQESHSAMKHDIAVDASVARALVAVEAASAQAALLDSGKAAATYPNKTDNKPSGS